MAGIFNSCPLPFLLLYHLLSFSVLKFAIFLFFSYKVHTLLKGLEKIAASADIPMLVCGDFSSIPGRFVIQLMLPEWFLILRYGSTEAKMTYCFCTFILQCSSCPSCYGES